MDHAPAAALKGMRVLSPWRASGYWKQERGDTREVFPSKLRILAAGEITLLE